MVRQRSYTEAEQIAILNAVLENKELLEAQQNNRFSRDEAWGEKWDEIAAMIDAYFGTSRGVKKIRSLYQQWKSAAKKKYKSTRITPATEDAFKAMLSTSETILRQIRPDLFPKVDAELVTSAKRDYKKGTDGGSDEGTDEQEEEPQSPESLKNHNEEASDDDEVAEENGLEDSEVPVNAAKVSDDIDKLLDNADTGAKSTDWIPSDCNDADMDTLVLSLQSMIDIQSAMETLEGVNVDADLEDGSAQMMEDADDIAAIEDAKMQKSVQKKSNIDAEKENPEISIKPPKAIVETDETVVLNSEGFPKLPVFKIVGKRKKAPRATKAKKRKVDNGTSASV